MKLLHKPIKFTFLLSLIISLSFLFNFCTFSPDGTKPDNHFSICDTNYFLDYGVIKDYGTNYEITGRNYTILLKSANSFIPANYVNFDIVSTSTSRLNEGTYSFNEDNEAGTFSQVEIGYDLKYDQTYNAVEGKRIYADTYMKTGQIELSMENGDYVFEFDFELMSNDSTYHITGYFTDVLHDESTI